jgi:hypothetical protein
MNKARIQGEYAKKVLIAISSLHRELWDSPKSFYSSVGRIISDYTDACTAIEKLAEEEQK